MSLNRTTLNVFAVSLLETLDERGVPEGHAYAASMHLGFTLDDFQTAVAVLIKGKLIERTGTANSPVLKPGEKFEAVKAEMQKAMAAKGIK